MFPDSQNTSPEKHGQTGEATHSFLLWHNWWVRHDAHTCMVSCESPLCSGAAFSKSTCWCGLPGFWGFKQRHLWRERFGGLVAYSVLQQHLKQVRDLWISWCFFNWMVFPPPGLIMLIGWLQGKHLLSMFTIGVRWGLESTFLFWFLMKRVPGNSLFKTMDTSQKGTWVRPFINTYWSCTGEINVSFTTV